jgi:hypothetical protein
VVLTTRIEAALAVRTLTSAFHVFMYGQNLLTSTAEHRSFTPSTSRPNVGRMGLACIVATNASVELVATEVLDGNDVEW